MKIICTIYDTIDMANMFRVSQILPFILLAFEWVKWQQNIINEKIFFWFRGTLLTLDYRSKSTNTVTIALPSANQIVGIFRTNGNIFDKDLVFKRLQVWTS